MLAVLSKQPAVWVPKLTHHVLLWQVEVRQVDAGRSEGNLLYLLHVYCDDLSRLLEKHNFRGFGK